MKLEDLSIRARVAYAALSLELLLKNKIKEYKKDKGWKFVLDKIWSYTVNSPGEWHYPMAELTPSSIEEDIDFSSKEFEFLSKDQHDEILETYRTADADIKRIIELIFEIGTLDLYSSIVDKSPKTLSMLEDIVGILRLNGMNPPDLKNFKAYNIGKYEGWGEKFDKKDLNSLVP